MSLKKDDFPSSAAFDDIAAALKADDKARQAALKEGKAIFAFKITNSAGKTESWHIDMKETGTVGLGLAPEGKKPNVTLELSDENFAGLVSRKKSAQTLFMSGKLKIRGDVMKATKMEPILARAGGQSKL